MQGSFETAACGGGRAGRCVRQMATTKPIEWNVDSEPFALLGDGAWTDYTLAADVYFEQAGSAELIARAGKQASGQGTMDGYYLVVGSGGAWSIQRNTWRGTGRVTLCSGTVAAPGTGSWHRLGLTANGNVLTATLDGATLGSVTDATYGHGQIGIGTGGYQTVQFDNLSVSPLRADYGQAWHAIENRGSGKVLEVPGASTADGVLVDQRTDSGGAAQKWALLADGSGYVKVVNRNSGKVLDDPGWSTAAGTQLDQWADAGSANEQWLAQEHADGTVTLTNRYSGLVADVSGASGADGAPVIQWPDHGGANQRWLLKAEFTPGRTYAIVNRAGGKVLEVPGASTSDGTRIDQWTYFSSVGHHHWRVEPTDSGYVKFINVNSGKALDNTGASPAVNNPLEQWTDIGVANEQWQVVPVGAGYYQLRNRQSGLVATVLNPGPGDGEGAPVVQAAPSGPASEWLFLQM
jgi:hypothetical protein